MQDTLKSCGWNVTNAIAKVREDMKSISTKMPTKFFNQKKNHHNRVKVHEAVEFSDSDEEDEYGDENKVFDSDSDAEEEEINEKALPEDKKRVLDFFNTGNEHELSAIQGKIATSGLSFKTLWLLVLIISYFQRFY